MKKLLIFSLTIAALCLPVAAQNAQEPISLEQFRKMVADYSNHIKMSRENTSASQSKLKVVRTGYYPSLNASADANYLTNSPMSFDIPGMDISLKNFTYNANLTIQQNVYTGNAVTNQTRAAKIEVDIAKMGEDLTLENVLYGADVTYWALAASGTQLQVMNRYVEIVTDLFNIVENRFVEGYVSRTDLLMVQTRLNEAKLQQISAKRLYDNSLQNLNMMIGQYQTVNYIVTDTIGSPNAMPKIEDLNFALENRSDFKISTRKVDLMNQQMRLSRAKFNPQIVVGFQGIVGTSNPNFTGKSTIYGVAFASLRAPIFHWGERQNTVAQARAGVRAQEYDVVDTRDAVALELQNANTNLTQSFEQADVAMKNLDIAQDNLELNTFSYNEGRLPILDVLSAQLSWIQSYTAAVNSNYQYKVSMADYRKATGTAADY